MPIRCSAKTSSGVQCNKFGNPMSGLCFTHDPAMHERAQEARSRGGRGGRVSAERIDPRRLGERPVTIPALIDFLANTARDVRSGQCDHLRGAAVAQLSKELSRLIQIRDAQDRPEQHAEELAGMSDADLARMLKTNLRLLEGAKAPALSAPAVAVEDEEEDEDGDNAATDARPSASATA